MLRQLDIWTTSWWFGNALLLAMSVGVLFVAALMTPSVEVVQLAGWDVPMVCQFRSLFGIGCPGCGLTRSFAFMAEGQWRQAWEMNLMGPPLFTVVVAQIPWRLITLWREGRSRVGTAV